MKRLLLFILLSITTTLAHAADIKALESLFKANFNTLYVPRMCGQNIGRLIQAAQNKKINLSNSVVLKVVGGGFLETSGFYTRGAIHERAMLGYFHFVLVADGYVFDFDLDEPLVLKLEDYVRLQFTPPYQPYKLWGIDMNPKEYLPSWEVSGLDISSFNTSHPRLLWKKPMSELINIQLLLSRHRVR